MKKLLLTFVLFFVLLISNAQAIEPGLFVGRAWKHQGFFEGTESADFLFIAPYVPALRTTKRSFTFSLDAQAVIGIRLDEPAHLLGIGPTLRTYYNIDSELHPYLIIGVGLTYSNQKVDGMSTNLNFSTEWGIGAKMNVLSYPIMLEYKMYHTSNAGIVNPNLGQTMNCLMVGVEF